MIFKRLIFYLGIILLVSACYQYNKPEKPKNLISKDKMVELLMDIKIISSANASNKKVLEDQKINLEKYILKKHNIDSLQFALSNNYYAYNIKEYEEIFTKVKDSLEKLEIIYKKLALKEAAETKTQKKNDSILNSLIKGKDSLTITKIKDSLRTIIKKDSLTEETLLKIKFEEERLISPVSDIEYQY